MEILEHVTLGDVISNLEKLGKGNHENNVKVLNDFSKFQRAKLSRAEFDSLLFYRQKLLPRFARMAKIDV